MDRDRASPRPSGIPRQASLLALLGVLACACSAGAPGPGIDVDRAMATTQRIVAQGPRPARSERVRAIADDLVTELAGMGLAVERAPVGEVELPGIVVLGHVHRQAHRVALTDDNLVVRFGPRTGNALLIMAHYDSVPTGPGAADNAAAVATLVELARVLAAAPPRAPIVLAFTAGEEIGLVGAEALAAQLRDDVGLAISLDLIGGDGALSLNGAGALIGGAELRWLAAAADRAGVVVRMPLAHRVVSRWWPQSERSDHGAFTRRGVRAFHLYQRGADGELIDLAYHSPRDDFARISRASLDELGRLLRALVEVAPPPPAGDGFWVPVAVNTVVPRWLLVALEVGLAGLALAMLIGLRGARARGGLGLLAGLGAVALAVGVTYAVERVTAGAHPAPWLHAPGRHLIALALVLAGGLGLATRLAARWSPWIGANRYLAVGIALPLAIGVAWLAAGAAELAWIWLVPAALAGVAPRLGRLRLLAVIAALWPAVLVLAPDQLREAAWNGFAPAFIPGVAWLAVVGGPVLPMAAWYLRHRPHSGPLGTLVLPVGWALATILGILWLAHAEPPCTAAQFHEFHLACESGVGVR